MIINKPAFDANKLTPGSAFKVSTSKIALRNTLGNKLHMMLGNNILVTHYTPFKITAIFTKDGETEKVEITLDHVQSGLVILTPLVPETQAATAETKEPRKDGF